MKERHTGLQHPKRCVLWVLQGNVPSISLLLLALPIWMAVQSCECAEEGWLYIGMSTAGCGLLLIPAIYSCVVPSVDHLQIYCFSQAARYTRMAAVKLASVLGMKDPKVSLAWYALHLCVLP